MTFDQGASSAAGDSTVCQHSERIRSRSVGANDLKTGGNMKSAYYCLTGWQSLWLCHPRFNFSWIKALGGIQCLRMKRSGVQQDDGRALPLFTEDAFWCTTGIFYGRRPREKVAECSRMAQHQPYGQADH